MNSIDLGKQKAALYFFDMLLSTIAIAIAGMSIVGLLEGFLPQCGIVVWCEVFSPVLFWANLLLVTIWIIRRKTLSFLFFFNLIPAAIALPYLFQFSLNDSLIDHPNNQIKVVSYNIRSFNFYTRKAQPSTEEIAAWLIEENPDVICLQEYSYFEKKQRDNLRDFLLQHFPYQVEHLISNRSVGSGNIILSKHPIIKQNNDFPKNIEDYLLWSDINIRGKIVRFLNIHLKTTELNQTQQTVKRSLTYTSDRSTHQSSINLIKKFTNNALIRNNEAETIKQFINFSPNPVVVCGDFNATAFAHSYQTISKKLNSAFDKSGNGYSYTYKPLFRLLRIDHILFSKEFKGLFYQSPSLPYSDHDPVVSIIKFASLN